METDTLAMALRQALRTLARSVVVVSTKWGGRRYAITATAMSEVSLDPPSMLVCLNKRSSIIDPVAAGAPLALNVLSADHQAVSRACGGECRGDERFAVGEWTQDHMLDIPYLLDACAVVMLEQAQTIDHGSHRIVVGNVSRVITSAVSEPLLYCAGAYRQIEPRAPIALSA